MTTIATLMSGGEGAGVGARAAGLTHLWGIEIDDDIAAVARRNGFNVATADLFNVDPAALPRPDVLHASPECQNASVAKAGAQETELDRRIAGKIVEFLEVMQPPVFTLENVYFYRKFKAFKMIVSCLRNLGHFIHYANLNAADFGVPQTRRRLILRAVQGRLLPMLPAPEPWKGWYQAIEDLLPDLPDSDLADWQKRLLCDDPKETALFSQGISRDREGNEYPLCFRTIDEPAYTVTANSNMNGVRACIVSGQYDRPASEPGRRPQVREGSEPSFTVTASYKGDWRAIPVDSQNAGRDYVTTRMDREPAFTVTNPAKARPRAVLSTGRIVRLDNRCLARFQAFPDWYELPDSKTVAARLVGNAVPPLMYQKIVEGLQAP